MIEKINDYISYIPSTEVPISSDVGIIYGKKCTYIFDVGSIPESLDYLHSLDGKIIIVVSHFHGDHTWWLTKHRPGEEGVLPGDTISLSYEPIKYEKLYIGKGTEKYLPDGEVVKEPLIIEDEISDNRNSDIEIRDNADTTSVFNQDIADNKRLKLEIIPMPSSHAKGSLALIVNDEYIFMGDSTYCRYVPKKQGEEEHAEYNVQKLREQIDILKAVIADKCVLSHEKKVVRPKKVVIRQLESIYSQRIPGSNVIVLKRNTDR